MWLRFFLELFSYSCFVCVLYVISYSNHNLAEYYQVKQLRQMFLNPHNLSYNFFKITSTNDYWRWLEKSFVNNIFALEWYNGDPVEFSDGYLNDKTSRLIGWATMRQLRIQPDTCRRKPSIRGLIPDCFNAYSQSNEDRQSYFPGWIKNQSSTNYSSFVSDAFKYRTSKELDTYLYIGEHATYGSGGYVYEFRGSFNETQSDLAQLHHLGWVDRQTRAVLIQMNLYNPSVPIFTSAVILFEFLPSSGIFASSRFEPLDFDSFSTIFQIICIVIYFIFIVYFMIVEVLELKRLKKAYFRQAWSYIELGIIICSWTSVGIHVWRESEVKRVSKLSAETQGKTYINFQLMAYINDIFSFLLGFCCFFGTLKFLRLCRYNRRLALLSNTLRRAARELISFSLMFSVIFSAFLTLFYLQFNALIWDCASLLHTAQMLFEMLLLKFDATEIVNAGAFLGPFYFTLFVLFVVFVCINMFVSIINDNFRIVRANVHKVDHDDQDVFIRAVKKLQRWCGSDETNKVAPELTLSTARVIQVSEMPSPIHRLSKKLDQLTVYVNEHYYVDDKVRLVRKST